MSNNTRARNKKSQVEKNEGQQSNPGAEIIHLKQASCEAVPDWITDQLIQSFSSMVKQPNRRNVRTFVHSVRTFQMWDAESS